MLPDVSPPEVVTECWVEACAHEKAVLAPDSNLVFRPLPFPMPLAGANEIFVHVTGFKTEQGVYLRRLLKAAGKLSPWRPLTTGMNVQNKLDRDRTTHVVLAAPQGVKYEKAMEWGMAIVRQSWVWALGNEGRIDPVEKHALVDGGGEAGPSSAPRASSARFGTSLDVPTLGLTRRSRASTPSGGNVPLSPKERVLNRATDTPDDSASPATTPKATAVHDDVTAQLRRLAEGDAAPRSAAVSGISPSSPSFSFVYISPSLSLCCPLQCDADSSHLAVRARRALRRQPRPSYPPPHPPSPTLPTSHPRRSRTSLCASRMPTPRPRRRSASSSMRCARVRGSGRVSEGGEWRGEADSRAVSLLRANNRPSAREQWAWKARRQ